uniref:peptidylglycine monooxygenase n=1 Tax=Globodera pallida TaxID=36090 RepID=A0A183CLC9_GLOPA
MSPFTGTDAMRCLSSLRPHFLFYFTSILIAFSAAASVRRLPNEELKRFDIQIQGYTPSQDDDYVAVAVKAEAGYIVEFEPFAHADRVHHMLLYGCSSPAYTDRNFWQGMATCGDGGSHILYAWARNAPSLKLPKDVAFAIGNEGDPVQYVVLQIHYAKQFAGNVRDFSGLTLHLSSTKSRFLAGVYLFLSGDSILPGHAAFFTNMSCTYNSDTKLYPFAFRTHTHQMGRVVSAYVKKSDGEWYQIGKRNPQWPQLFQPRENPGKLVISKGDFMAGTCRYDSSDKHEIVPMGSMGMNEMCNFYMMFYWDAVAADPFPYGAGCFGDQSPEGMKEYPNDGFTLLPTHADWEHTAHQSARAFGVVERERLTALGGERLGQVAGLAVERQSGDLWILHRAGRVWGANTFDGENRLIEHKPIGRSVLLVARKDNGPGGKLRLLAKFGRDLFYLPHGIFVEGTDAVGGAAETVNPIFA